MHLGRRLFATSFATLATFPTPGSTAASMTGASRVIDSAIHLWSDGEAPFPWASPPPAELRSAGSPEAFLAAAREAGVGGALVVQPANHMHDHSYVSEALKAHPTFFRGMGLANPTLPPEEAIAALEALHTAGFVGVRFNAGAFEGGLCSDVGRALYQRAGELGMPVGVMAFKGLAGFVPDLKRLCSEFPSTTLVVDHMGFFRQPASGGQLGDAAANDEASWQGLLDLAAYPQVFVKVSALFRASGEAPPFVDLQPRVRQLLNSYGSSRLMWGSDYPFVLPGGFPLPEGVSSTPAALTYAQAAAVPAQWSSVPGLDDAARAALMGGTAAKLFGFGGDKECAGRGG
ncbi:hypothetical protein EMIHUDRAFT_64168 [Emiliania huxleyi CCMP1516]|uniref:Amidohydrolase-related domain-containing protein n=2 Tax=Emiliania huxleyi TaxID=2903 RepID=A0A0D3JXU4_EMIH1|nr:hypothetical protein EMIHUDRAFT_64168 [Emiliania huxleyi CCMP1516]EOD28329.1 hypothetical protein EMIHUDRAFT_64168 [Emiliania huxleyi CCMP1516]|eukprot:XP_005780758.1 hypothetical protein EMIHUDRAFT_64168 [Emiliania huxleyi CCMP1516]